jgi:hypothetical protein
MSRLPGPEDLGATPAVSGSRPIGQINAEPIARGYQQLGQGIERLGAGAADLGDAKARYDYALARGGQQADIIGLEEQMRHDTNYGPDANGQNLVQRYQSAAGAIRDKWAGSISSGPMRQRFVESTAPLMAEGVAKAQEHSFGLVRDHSIAAVDTLGEDLGNKGMSVDDPGVHTRVMDTYGHAVDGLVGQGYLTQDQAVARKRQFGAGLAEGLLRQQGLTDPQGALNHTRAAPGSDDELVERIVQVESGGNPKAKASTSSAYGAAQFLESRPGGDQTWAQLVGKYHPELTQGRSLGEINALRADPNLSREMLGHLVDTNRGYLQNKGLQPTAGNLYLSHFLGPAGAAAVIAAPPGTPVIDALTKALGPARAQQDVTANQSVLAGKTAGSVTAWSDRKMGGYSPGEGSIYQFIPPGRRAQLEEHFFRLTQAQAASGLADLKTRVEDNQAEAFRTGGVTKPIGQGEFISQLGPQDGPKAYAQHQANVQLGVDGFRAASMSPDEQQRLLSTYEPKPGEGFAVQASRHDALGKQIEQISDQRASDPGGFAIARLPATGQAYKAFSDTMNDPTANDDARQAAARRFAATTQLEQGRIGIAPDDQRILPKDYATQFNKTITASADSDDPQKRIGLVAQVQHEAAMWGDQWPAVMRQLAPGAQPIVRAIAAGADPVAMTRLLSLPKDEAKRPATILAQQNDTKFKDLTAALNDAMAPFRRSLVGRQLDRDYPGYYGLANELGALHVRDGDSATDGAAKAFKELIGGRYDFRDTWRIPKSAGVSADDAQQGTQALRGAIGRGEITDIKPAANDIGLDNPRADSIEKFARDGTFVTAPDNSGLNLVYGDKFVRRGDGKPVLFGWGELASRAKADRGRAGEQAGQQLGGI